MLLNTNIRGVTKDGSEKIFSMALKHVGDDNKYLIIC
jgi:hypothetical protein